jgi:large subunit ribosomal protein L6e
MAREIVKGVRAVGRTRTFRKKGRFHHLKKTNKSQSESKTTTSGQWYEADDVSTPLKSRKVNAGRRTARLRTSITPGTVLILLAGRFRGKRVVFLKQLASGLLLVVGPFKINGVPLRRVNQAYVIATQTRVNLPTLSAIKNINDSSFKSSATKSSGEFTDSVESKRVVSDAIKNATKQVDAALLPVIKKTEFLSQYLNARFSLSKNDRPHLMTF